MRFRFPILVFLLTFIASLGLEAVHTFVVEWQAPGFTKEEAMEMVGHRVRNVRWEESFMELKCPEHMMVWELCTDVKAGERGTIVGVEETSPYEYFGVVRWDESSQGVPLQTHFGRMARRMFLKVE